MTTDRLYPEGLLGRKLGMSQIFTAEGNCVPVTVIQTGPCFILDVKNKDKHGYSAVQLGFGTKEQKRVDKAMAGHFSRAGKGAFYHVREMRCDIETLGWTEMGKELKVGDVFKDGEFVDVSGVSKGRGFSGVVRRYKVKGSPATRGTHEYERHIGSIGGRKTPARVRKNQRMPGHMGVENVTVQNLKVVGVKPEENLLLVRGGVPGCRGSLLFVRKAMKRRNVATQAA